MPLFSEQIQDLSPAVQRRLYTQFQRAVKRGELPALKLLSRFELIGSKGQSRAVFDYAYATSMAPQLATWLAERQESSTRGGITADQARQMSDEELTALIAQQQSPKRPRKARKPRNPKDQKGMRASSVSEDFESARKSSGDTRQGTLLDSPAQIEKDG